MASSGYDAGFHLSRRARALHRAARAPRRLPALFFFTDPRRVADPCAVVETLPPGAGVVFRHFGRDGAKGVAARLARICARRRLTLLIAADAELAARVGAHGVHLPEALIAEARRVRRRRRSWLITAAAHGGAALRRAAYAGVDAAFLSPVFATRSDGARAPLGAARFRRLVQNAGIPVIALGGVTPRTARALAGSGAVGLAAVNAFVENL